MLTINALSGFALKYGKRGDFKKRDNNFLYNILFYRSLKDLWEKLYYFAKLWYKMGYFCNFELTQ